MKLTLPSAVVSGKLADYDESNSEDIRLALDTNIPKELEGKTILFDSHQRSDASYRIEKVVSDRVISIGSNSLAEEFRNKNDYTKGVKNTVTKGNGFVIPLSVRWKK